MMVWNWTVRLALPVLLGILAAALHVMWSEAPYKPGVLDVIGTAGIGVAMLGIVVWCVCAWLGCEGGSSAPLPPATEARARRPALVGLSSLDDTAAGGRAPPLAPRRATQIPA